MIAARMKRIVFHQIEKLVPKISETEMIALRSGGVHIDRDIFQGRVCLKTLYKNKPKSIASHELRFLRQTEELLKKYEPQELLYPNPKIKEIMQELGRKGYLSMMIPEKYDGNPISYATQARILTKIASFHPSLAVIVMVPNSLGPAELLCQYGTESQKQEHLPLLASGRCIPCFALTGPLNGSDAVGMIDEGVVEITEYGEKYIRIPSLEKRYITLAPIANLIAVAFRLKDPKRLLSNEEQTGCGGKEGVTIALLEHNKERIQITRHDPNGCGFPNGTIRANDLKLDINSIIGGEEKAGHGWKMIMECLSVGRGISLPSSANGSSKLITYAIYHYIQHRKQFKLPIGDLEGVQEKFIEMYYHSFIINASVQYIGHIIDEKHQNKETCPSVLSAIMKQQCTERGRKVIQLGMDIYAGSGLCRGENNFFTSFYQSCPIGITVEGSNTLTRSLIIFGQGLNKSHPHIYPIVRFIQQNDIDNTMEHFFQMIKDSISVYCKCLFSNIIPFTPLEKKTLQFSNAANFVALLGGNIKSRQIISGNMADVLSCLFLAYSVKWYCHHHFPPTQTTKQIEQYMIGQLCNEAEQKLNAVVYDYPLAFLRPFLFSSSFSRTPPPDQCSQIKHIHSLLKTNPYLIEDVKKDIYYHKNSIINKLEILSTLPKDSLEYMQLYKEIIKVGEFPID